jgi:hypothetical protein
MDKGTRRRGTRRGEKRGQGEGRKGDKERGEKGEKVSREVWKRLNFVIKIVCYEN